MKLVRMGKIYNYGQRKVNFGQRWWLETGIPWRCRWKLKQTVNASASLSWSKLRAQRLHQWYSGFFWSQTALLQGTHFSLRHWSWDHTSWLWGFSAGWRVSWLGGIVLVIRNLHPGKLWGWLTFSVKLGEPYLVYQNTLAHVKWLGDFTIYDNLIVEGKEILLEVETCLLEEFIRDLVITRCFP